MQLKENKVLFKAIKEEKTCIKAKHKAIANFATMIFHVKPQKTTQKRKIEFVKWPKYKYCNYKYLTNQICKRANKKCDKYHKKESISCFYDSYISLNKGKSLYRLNITLSLDFKKNVSCVSQVIANKIFETGISQ